jgi:hypothetical protein
LALVRKRGCPRRRSLPDGWGLRPERERGLTTFDRVTIAPSIKQDTQGFHPLKQEPRDLLFGASSPHAHLVQREALKVLQLKNYPLVVRQARQGVCEASQFLL